jgi:hypothetical protein
MDHIYTDNEKLEKVEATKKIRALFGARVLIGEQDKVQEAPVRADSACDRDGDVLRDQVSEVLV